MKKTDFPILEYQILSYFYDNIQTGKKTGKREDFEKFLPDINPKYFDFVFYSMSESKLIEGLHVNKNGDEIKLGMFPNCQITVYGIHYLFESPLMKEAKRYVDGELEWG